MVTKARVLSLARCRLLRGRQARRKGEAGRGRARGAISGHAPIRSGGMRLGSRERVALRGVRVNGGLRQARIRARGFRPLAVARLRHEAHERVRGGDARSGTRLRSSARGLRVSVRFTAAARGLLLVALAREIASRTPASPSPGRPAAAKSAARSTTNPTPSKAGDGRANAGGVRQLTHLCSRVVRVAEVGKPSSGSEKRAPARAGGETPRARVRSA